jgi:hypothetical protein
MEVQYRDLKKICSKRALKKTLWSKSSPPKYVFRRAKKSKTASFTINTMHVRVTNCKNLMEPVWEYKCFPLQPFKNHEIKTLILKCKNILNEIFWSGAKVTCGLWQETTNQFSLAFRELSCSASSTSPCQLHSLPFL